MAPKVNCNPLKLASIVTYFQKSRVAHNIKELEKHLPSVASINGMQVKEYLQALSDENQINVEKIGSGNWYWSFASQSNKTRQKALDETQAAHDKANAVNDELKAKLAEVQAQRADEEDMLDDAGESRDDLMVKKAQLEAGTKQLRKELAAYSDNDPTELERKRKEMEGFKAEAGLYTDNIYSMEGWFKDAGQDNEAMMTLRMTYYGDEFDAEEGGLKDLQ